MSAELRFWKTVAADADRRSRYTFGTSWKANGTIEDVIARLEADLSSHTNDLPALVATRRSGEALAVPGGATFDYIEGTPDPRVYGYSGMQNTGYLAPATRTPTFYGRTSCAASLGDDVIATGNVTVIGKDQFNRTQFSLYYNIDYVGSFSGSGGTSTTVSGDAIAASSNGVHYCDSALYGKLNATESAGGYV
jgi:hypothetical protein